MRRAPRAVMRQRGMPSSHERGFMSAGHDTSRGGERKLDLLGCILKRLIFITFSYILLAMFLRFIDLKIDRNTM